MSIELGAGNFGTVKKVFASDLTANTFNALPAAGATVPDGDGVIKFQPAGAAPLMLKLEVYSRGTGNPGGAIEVWGIDLVYNGDDDPYNVLVPLMAQAFSTSGTPATRDIFSGVTAKFPDTLDSPTVGNNGIDTVSTQPGSGGPAGSTLIVVNTRGFRRLFIRMKTDGVATQVNVLAGVCG